MFAQGIFMNLAVTLCWLTFACVPVLGQEPAKATQRKVVTGATYSTRVQPNGAIITFAVNINETENQSTREAQEKMDKKVRETITSRGLAKVDVQIHSMPNSFGTLIQFPARAVVGKHAQIAFQISIKEDNLNTL